MTHRQPDVLIIDNDSIRAIGLRRLLKDHHNARVTTCRVKETDPEKIASSSLIFISPEALLAAPDIFMPRRQSVILISSAHSSLTSIDPTAPADIIIESLADIVNNLNSDNLTLPAKLTPRETDVLRLVAKGYINKEIADELNISFNTVLTHRRNISSKLGIKSTSGLGVYAIMNGLINAPGI